jgi:hypothetical protein
LNDTRVATFSEYGYGSPWGTLEIGSGWVVLALAIAGLFARAWRRVPLGIWLAPLLLWLSTVALQAVPRFRAVIDPFLIQLAAVALVGAVRALSDRRRSDSQRSSGQPVQSAVNL